MSETRSVNLKEEHIEWIDQNAINLSKWVRNKIDEVKNQ